MYRPVRQEEWRQVVWKDAARRKFGALPESALSLLTKCSVQWDKKSDIKEFGKILLGDNAAPPSLSFSLEVGVKTKRGMADRGKQNANYRRVIS